MSDTSDGSAVCRHICGENDGGKEETVDCCDDGDDDEVVTVGESADLRFLAAVAACLCF